MAEETKKDAAENQPVVDSKQALKKQKEDEKAKKDAEKQLQKQQKLDAKAKKALEEHQQKINKKIVELEAKKKECQDKLNKEANPKKREALKEKIENYDNKIADYKDPTKHRPSGLVVRTWAKGLSKEANRIAWENKRDVIKDFVTVVIVCVVLALVFFAIDMILISIGK